MSSHEVKIANMTPDEINTYIASMSSEELLEYRYTLTEGERLLIWCRGDDSSRQRIESIENDNLDIILDEFDVNRIPTDDDRDLYERENREKIAFLDRFRTENESVTTTNLEKAIAYIASDIERCLIETQQIEEEIASSRRFVDLLSRRILRESALENLTAEELSALRNNRGERFQLFCVVAKLFSPIYTEDELKALSLEMRLEIVQRTCVGIRGTISFKERLVAKKREMVATLREMRPDYERCLSHLRSKSATK